MISKSMVTVIAAAISSMTIVEMPAGIANAGEIKVLYVGSLRSSLTELIPSFEKSSGHKVKAEAGAAGEMVAALPREASN
jgi:ABC-type molybdate transport system substrate-binding protein